MLQMNYLNKIEQARNNPSYEYSYNNACVGLEYLIKEYRWSPEDFSMLENFSAILNELDYYNHWTHCIDKNKMVVFIHVIERLYQFLIHFKLD